MIKLGHGWRASVCVSADGWDGKDARADLQENGQIARRVGGSSVLGSVPYATI